MHGGVPYEPLADGYSPGDPILLSLGSTHLIVESQVPDLAPILPYQDYYFL